MKKISRQSGDVHVTVKGKNITITPALHDLVVQKMTKLDRYHDRLETIEIELCTQKTRESDHHNHVEATTQVTGKTIRVVSEHGDMYAAIDEAVDKLYRQLNRQKERLKSHHGSRFTDSLPAEEPEGLSSASGDSSDGTPTPLVVQRLEMKPLFEDEAIDEIESSKDQILVYLNARNEQVNVLYRRSDGALVLIDPHVG